MSFYSGYADHMGQIESELRNQIMHYDFPLYRLMAYQMGWVDSNGEALAAFSYLESDRIRSLLCILACEGIGGNVASALPSAAAVELLHNFSVIHEDIRAGLPERDYKSTVWWEWGPAQAINAGDGMHALARLALLSQPDGQLDPVRTLKSVNLLDQACLRLCEGQYLDLTYQERVDVTPEAYFRMVEGKSGALMGCAAALGAIVATGEMATIDALSNFGLKLGVGAQIRRDINDIWRLPDSGESPSPDILNKKKSLPVIYALQNATGQQKHVLGDIYFRRVMEPDDLGLLIDVLETLGARDYAQEKVDLLKGEAIESLESATLTTQGKYNLEMLASNILV